MTLTEIRNMLWTLSNNVYNHDKEYVSEQLMVISDYVKDFEEEVIEIFKNSPRRAEDLRC